MVAVVPAAGRGERFGGAKLLARVGRRVLIDLTLESLVEGGADRIVVVMAPGADPRAAAGFADSRVRIVTNPDPWRGMFSSIHAGLEHAHGDPVLVLPADMPFVSPRTVAVVARAASDRGAGIVVPVHGGRRGHPVAFPAAIGAHILAASPDSNLKAALRGTGAEWLEIEVDDPGILHDVDTLEDLTGPARRTPDL